MAHEGDSWLFPMGYQLAADPSVGRDGAVTTGVANPSQARSASGSASVSSSTDCSFDTAGLHV